MISHHCYIRNIGSLLEKALETGGFRMMKFQCSFLGSRSRDLVPSGAELVTAQLETLEEQGPAPKSRTVAPNPPSCSLFLPHPKLGWQKSWNSPISVSGSEQFTWSWFFTPLGWEVSSSSTRTGSCCVVLQDLHLQEAPLPSKGFHLGDKQPQPARLVQWLNRQFLNDHRGKQS